MRRLFLPVLLGVSAVGLFVFLQTQYTFGFVPLFILLVFFILYPIAERWTRNWLIRKGADEYYFANPAVPRYVLVVLFGCAALWAFDNYVHPSPLVFRNSDHHLLRVDGIEIPGNRFVLAENSPNAFLDDARMRGRLTVLSADSSGVILERNRFSEPVYKISGGNMRNYEMLSTRSFASFVAGDTVRFIHREGGHDRITTLLVEEHFRDYPWHYFISRFFNHERDSVHYRFISSDGQEQVSTETRFLKSGLPMASLMSDVIQDFDPKGIQIVRRSFDMDLKAKDVRSYYSADSLRRYYVLLNADSDVSVRVSPDRRRSLTRFDEETTSRAYDDTIPLRTPFVVGFGNSKSDTYCFNFADGQLRLEYYLPDYHYLTSSNEAVSDQSLMVTTTLYDATGQNLLEAYSENIALVDQFSHPDNIFHMRPWFLSYRSGESGKPLSFKVSGRHFDDSERISLDRFYFENGESFPRKRSETVIPTEAYFPGLVSVGGGANWLVGVEDFSQTTPFTARRMALLILAVVLLSAGVLRFGPVAIKPDSRKVVLTNDLEYSVFLIVIAFLTIRCFLMWRETVFPPVTSISYFEFHHFRDPGFFKWLLVSIFAFYATIVFFKSRVWRPVGRSVSNWAAMHESFLSRFRGWKRFNVLRSRYLVFHDTLFYWFARHPWGMALLLVTVYVMSWAVFGHITTIERFTNILLPVFLFLLFEYLIHSIYSRSYDEDIRDVQGYNGIGDRMIPVVLSFCNVLLVSAYTFLKDGGYGVMFLLFGIFFCLFLVSDLRYYTNEFSHPAVKPCRRFLFFVVLLVPFVYKQLFIWILDHRLVFTIALFLVLTSVFFAIAIVLDFFDDLKEKGPWIPVPKWVWCVVFLLVSCVTFFFAAGSFIDGKHLEYRTRVHMDSPSNILADHIPDDASRNRFMQASLNDWILEEYSEMGKDVNPFFEKGKGYFKMQPQSKLGAMWFAQSTDIVLSRFIIAEHSEGLAILFVVAFLMLLLISMSLSSQRRQHRVIQVTIPLLLFCQCMLIWLANTRRFIFFGQDFPLLSTTSSLSSIYFFSLLGVLLISAYLEKDYVDSGKDEYYQKLIDKNNRRASRHLLVPLALSAVVFFFFPNLFQRKDSDPEEEKVPGVYAVTPLMKQTAVAIDSLNNRFRSYQRNHRLHLASDMSGQLTGFYQTINQPDSGFIEHVRRSNKFAANMIDRYFTTESHANSVRKLMFVKNDRSYDEQGNPLDTLEFDLNSIYYYYRLPMKEQRAWKGSVVASPDRRSRLAVYQESQGDEFLRLKGEWLADGNGRALVHAANDLRVVGETSIVDVSPSSLPVAVFSSRDQLLRGRTPVVDGVLQHQDYFARNVLVNGQRTFLYPYGSQLFWLREFAQSIKIAKESDPDLSDSEDVPITIDSELSRQIYRTYMSGGYAGDKTVVVADGNGFIRAMVDYRSDEEHRLNPNDSRRISALLEDISLNGDEGSPRELRYFGTFATNPLRLGPGSSQKPIVWTAVTAGYGGHDGFWDRLVVEGVNDNYVPDARFPRFAGQQILKAFKSPHGDEVGISGNITLSWYMYKSSNFYNATMAYLGMLTPNQIDALWDDGLFKSGSYRSKAEYENLFPVMFVPGKAGRQSFDYFVSTQDYLNPQALLPSGLDTFFGLPSTNVRTRGLYASIPRYVIDMRTGQRVTKTSTFANTSFFNLDMRHGRTSVPERNEYGVRTVAIGNNSVWSVTPVKMTEMFGRLISLNQHYTLTLDPRDTSDYRVFPLSPTWEGGVESYRSHRRDFIQGMSQVFDPNVAPGIVGTARFLYNTVHGLGVEIDKGNNTGRYFIYGKTGTIDGKWNRQPLEDHLLAVVITDRRITREEDLSAVRYYVIYFVDYNYKVDYDYRSSDFKYKTANREIVEMVLQSPEFDRYMNE